MQTVRVRPASVVLVVSTSTDFLRRCGDVTIQVQSVVVEASEHSIATLAPQTRALAVVMPESVVATDPDHFQALTQDLGLQLVTFPDENIPQGELETRILGALSAAQKANRERR